MQITLRLAVVLGIVILLSTMYYLEDKLGREEVFWLYSSLGIIFGLTSVYTVAKDLPFLGFDKKSHIFLAVLFILMAILYYEGEEEEALEIEAPKEKPKRKKKRKKRRSKAG